VPTESAFNDTLPAASGEKVEMWAPPGWSVIIKMQEVVIDAAEHDRFTYQAPRYLVAQTILEQLPRKAVQVPDIEKI
jgi:hypothetical protein